MRGNLPRVKAGRKKIFGAEATLALPGVRGMDRALLRERFTC